MKAVKKAIAAAAIVLAAGSAGVSHAGTDLNEVGAFLVYPAIVALGNASVSAIETYISIVHTGEQNVNAHIVFINGNELADDYCYECNYTIPLTPNDAELLSIRFTPLGVQIDSEDGTLQGACPHSFGMITVNLEAPIGTVIADNTLLGSQVYVAYAAGAAISIPAIPFQGQNGGGGDRQFDFNGVEYGTFPRVVAADFIAPFPQISAELALFTLGFETGFPPSTHCEIEGFDAAENPFSRSFNFGCWTVRQLHELHPEFLYSNLGQQSCEFGVDCDTHGWLKLDCDVTYDGTTVEGGVHGAIVQFIGTGGTVRRNDPSAPPMSNTAAWARVLYQSVTTGGPVSYTVAGPSGGLN